MVENSLGRLWVEGHPKQKDNFLPSEAEQTAYREDHSIQDEKWHYYLEEAEQETGSTGSTGRDTQRVRQLKSRGYSLY